MEKMLGRVSRDMHRTAVYVRVHIPASHPGDSGPLAIKATIGNFSKSTFKKGMVVEITRSTHNICGAKYHVTEVFDLVDTEKDDRGDCCDCCDLEDDDNRVVRFFLGQRYFKEERDRRAMMDVLRRSFSMSQSEAAAVTNGFGMWIACRETQFARFLINRDFAGIPNGFQDLRVEYADVNRPKKIIHVYGRR